MSSSLKQVSRQELRAVHFKNYHYNHKYKDNDVSIHTNQQQCKQLCWARMLDNYPRLGH